MDEQERTNGLTTVERFTFAQNLVNLGLTFVMKDSASVGRILMALGASVLGGYEDEMGEAVREWAGQKLEELKEQGIEVDEGREGSTVQGNRPPITFISDDEHFAA